MNLYAAVKFHMVMKIPLPCQHAGTGSWSTQDWRENKSDRNTKTNDSQSKKSESRFL